jgi:hypothetical protein
MKGMLIRTPPSCSGQAASRQLPFARYRFEVHRAKLLRNHRTLVREDRKEASDKNGMPPWERHALSIFQFASPDRHARRANVAERQMVEAGLLASLGSSFYR